MKALTHFALVLLLLTNASCSDPEKENQTNEIQNEIDTYLTTAMELHNIPGLALAVVNEDRIIYENYFGKASLENGTSVDNNTLFRVYSTTKLITSTGIFQLIQNGKLSLEDTASEYLDNLPEQWQEIKIKHLLSHSSGLPDIRRYESTLTDEELMEKLTADELEFVTGSQFRYNQTNYWFLGRIIEKITGTTFDEYILKNQFPDAENDVLFSSNSLEYIPDRANRYTFNGRTKELEIDSTNNGKRGHSGNGLNISLNRFIEWNKRLNNNELLDEKTKSEMWTPFSFTNQTDQFLNGWGTYPVNQLDSYGFSGGNLSAFRIFPESNTTIILLSNGYEIPAYDIIVNDIARMVIPELRTKEPALELDVMKFSLNNEFDKALESFKKVNEENPNSLSDNLKWNINGIGNSYSWDDQPEKAFEFYTLNADANPDWWVAQAALGEYYDAQKDTLNAIKLYQEAIRLNKTNESNYNGYMTNRISELKE